MHVMPDTTVNLNVQASALNLAKAASSETDVRAVIDVPLHVQTEVGGLRVGLNATTLPTMIEEFIHQPTPAGFPNKPYRLRPITHDSIPLGCCGRRTRTLSRWISI